MDERTAAILAEGLETIERVERGQRERAEELAEREQRLEGTYAQFTNEQPVRRARTRTRQPEPKATTMDADAWNKWADARISAAVQKRMEEFADIMGAEVGQLEARYNAELKRLGDEIAALRENRFNAEVKRLSDEVEALREDLRAALAKNVTPIRSSNVA